jgi:hypothetical protein
MSLFHRKPKTPREDFDTRKLWRAADRLTGWSWTGDGPLDPPRLLRDAANEIDRLRRLQATPSTESEKETR